MLRGAPQTGKKAEVDFLLPIDADIILILVTLLMLELIGRF